MIGGVAATQEMGAKVAVSVLIVGEGAALFAGFCPSWFTVRSPFFHEQNSRAGNVRAIRQGEAAAAATTLLIGAGSSYLVRSPLPLLAAVAVSGLMIVGYEYSMTHPAAEDAKTRDADSMSPMHLALAWRTPLPQAA